MHSYSGDEQGPNLQSLSTMVTVEVCRGPLVISGGTVNSTVNCSSGSTIVSSVMPMSAHTTFTIGRNTGVIGGVEKSAATEDNTIRHYPTQLSCQLTGSSDSWCERDKETFFGFSIFSEADPHLAISLINSVVDPLELDNDFCRVQ